MLSRSKAAKPRTRGIQLWQGIAASVVSAGSCVGDPISLVLRQHDSWSLKVRLDLARNSCLTGGWIGSGAFRLDDELRRLVQYFVLCPHQSLKRSAIPSH